MQLDKKYSIYLLNSINTGRVLYYTRIKNFVIKLSCISLPTEKHPAYVLANLTDLIISKYEFNKIILKIYFKIEP